MKCWLYVVHGSGKKYLLTHTGFALLTETHVQLFNNLAMLFNIRFYISERSCASVLLDSLSDI